MIESELLAAIRAAPDEDGPRLVYADWLMERGEPERAELISVQCALAHPEIPPERRKELGARQQRLIEAHGDTWLQALGLRPGEGRFVRGFLEELVLAGDRMSVVGEELLQQPVHSLYAIKPFEPSALLSLGWLERLDHLSFGGASLALADVAALVRSPRLAGLRALVIWASKLGDPGVAAVAGSEPLRSLRHLSLTGNQIGPRGAQMLAETPWKLSVLDLRSNVLGAQGVEALVGSPLLASVQTLALTGNLVSDAGASALGYATQLRALRRLELGQAGINDEGASALAEGGGLAELRHLDLHFNSIGSEGALALAQSHTLRQLQRLDLSGNPLPAETLPVLHQRLGSTLWV